MLCIPDFWEEEKGAPLFGLEGGLLSDNPDIAELCARAMKWASISDKTATYSPYEKPDNEMPRIVVEDAKRTFKTTEHRLLLSRFLTVLNLDFGDYAQGLSYVASFLSLFLKPEEAYGILSRCNSDPKYIPGYWKATAVGFATDAYVFNHYLQKIYPEVVEHLQKNGIFPETFCQKWFVGLCLHVLPFRQLFDFLDQFFQHGASFLFRFALSLISSIAEKLLAAKDPSKLFGLLRLDKAYLEPDYDAIVKGAEKFEVNPDVEELKKLRIEMYDKHLKARMERAPVENDSSDEIVFSDEEDD